MDNILNSGTSKWNEKMDKLDILKTNKRSTMISIIRNNKFIFLVFISLIILSTINFYLIYSFIKILGSI